jgi:2-polyprenyl-3-methyl-5-hydroxy-6-metoxy-1,4-benzoquinol methylase
MREDDIRPPDLLADYLRLAAEDAHEMFGAPGALHDRPCPGCDAPASGVVFEKHGFPYVRCARCATLFAARTPDNAGLSEFYRASRSQRYWAEMFFPAVAEARRHAIFAPRVAQLRTYLDNHRLTLDSLVDVGAGYGLFLEEARTAALCPTLKAVEPTASLAARCRDNGFAVFEGFASEAARDAEWRDAADMAVCFEVIEHVLSPAGLLRDLSGLVRPGGHVLVTGLAGTGFDIVTLGARSKAVSPPHHLNFLSPDGAERACAAAGLQLVDFATPGRLDVDIVSNALAGDPDALTDPFLLNIVTGGPDLRAAFQKFLVENKLSSHMWILARKSPQ